MKKLLLFVFIGLFAFGCASKRYAKKAKELEKAGLYVEAADLYYQSARANKKNVDAKIGLKKNGQMALDKKLADFETKYNNRNVKDAVYSYQDVLVYKKKIRSVGVDLNIPSDAEQFYKEVKEEYLDNRYNEGVSALDREDFNLALTIFSEIKKFDVNYRDIATLIVSAKYEPMYREAKNKLDNSKYRSAYYSFVEILKGSKGEYKEADILKKEAQEKAMITIAIIPFNAPYFTQLQTTNFTSKLIAGINNRKSPFITIKDYNVSRARSNSYIGNGVDIKAARAAGIKAVLVGKVSSYRVYNGRPVVKKKPGYIRRERKVKDKEGNEKKEVYYVKDVYFEYNAYNSVNMGVEYQLISTETGNVLSADALNKQQKDAIHFAKYDGSVKKLVPGYWKSMKYKHKEDRVYDDRSSVKRLHNLFRNRQQLASTNKLSDNLEIEICSVISDNIIKYNPE